MAPPPPPSPPQRRRPHSPSRRPWRPSAFLCARVVTDRDQHGGWMHCIHPVLAYLTHLFRWFLVGFPLPGFPFTAATGAPSASTMIDRSTPLTTSSGRPPPVYTYNQPPGRQSSSPPLCVGEERSAASKVLRGPSSFDRCSSPQPPPAFAPPFSRHKLRDATAPLNVVPSAPVCACGLCAMGYGLSHEEASED